MSRAGFWKKDWFLGLVVAVVLFLLGPADLLQSFERKAYDLGVRATDRAPSERIAVIAIDDASKPIDGRSDLFSLPVSLCQLACGRLPFAGESMAQLMSRISNQDPPSILDHNPAVPPGIVAFLQRALAKDADVRFQTGAEFAAALRAVPILDISL